MQYKTNCRLLLTMNGCFPSCAESKEESNLKEKYNAAVSSINLKLNALNQKRSKLYESYVDGILDEANTPSPNGVMKRSTNGWSNC